MSLAGDKINELKQIIHGHLAQLDLQGHIRNAINSSQSEPNKIMDENEILETLKKNGILDNIMKDIETNRYSMEKLNIDVEKPSKDIHKDAKDLNREHIRDTSKRFLSLHLNGGSAFLDHLDMPKSDLLAESDKTMTLHISYKDQRFASDPVKLTCEPDIKGSFLFSLDEKNSGSMIRLNKMLASNEPIHLVVTRSNGHVTSVLSSHWLDWRIVLSAPHSRCSVSVELFGIGNENKVPVGILNFRLELLPRLTMEPKDDSISAQICLEKTQFADRERLFLVYARKWWQEYIQIRPGVNDKRRVQIFAEDENGLNNCICLRIDPMQASRLLDTPRIVARFVSLIQENPKSVGMTSKQSSCWSNIHCILASGSGGVDDHSLLLCSLLLSFGLNCYVCLGNRISDNAHCSWVCTIDVNNYCSVTFWDSMTGQRYAHTPIKPIDPPGIKQPKPSSPYKTIGSMFNHKSFYANSQKLDLVEVCNFDLKNKSYWKAMSEDAIDSLRKNKIISTPKMKMFSFLSDTITQSEALESKLFTMITDHRLSIGLSTTFDSDFSYVLGPALTAYENERITGVTIGNAEFQQSIHNIIPDGHTFKGYPVQYRHCNAGLIFHSCFASKKSEVFRQIIDCRGDEVKFALRVKITEYAEHIRSIWIMFACQYRAIN